MIILGMFQMCVCLCDCVLGKKKFEVSLLEKTECPGDLGQFAPLSICLTLIYA